MLRRLPTALFLIAGLFGAVASAAEEPSRPSITSVTLSGGFSWRNTEQLAVGDQTRPTAINGTSPWLVRLRADWFPVRWLGVEGEGLGDFFTAIQDDGTPAGKRLDTSSKRGAARLGVALRFVSDGGFVLNGSLGYGVSAAPVIRYTALDPRPVPGSLVSHGPMARLGLGYTGARFEGLATATALLPVAGRVWSVEPQLWLAGRVADLGPTALWVGVDAALLLEGSPRDTVGYSGPSLRIALGVKVALLPPPAVVRTVEEGALGATTLRVKVLLPDGAVALGAQLSLDGAAAVPLDAGGELRFLAEAGLPRREGDALRLPPRRRRGPGHRGEGDDAGAPPRAPHRPGQTLGHRPGVGDRQARARRDGDRRRGAAGTDGRRRQLPLREPRTGAGEGARRRAGLHLRRRDRPGARPRARPPSTCSSRRWARAARPPCAASSARAPASRSRPASSSRAWPPGWPVTPEGRFFVTVPGGEYSFIISAPGYVTQTKKVVLADGDQAIVHTELQKVCK